jgi:CRISPR-associated protein Csd1
MSWLAKLHDTYECCFGNPRFADEENQPLPLSHSRQYVHLKVTLDAEGRFLEAAVLNPKQQMTIPATQESAGRTSGAAPHALIDGLEYCAGDYADLASVKPKARDKIAEKNQLYMRQLQAWAGSESSHPKAEAVLAYLLKKGLTADLIRTGILPTDESGRLRLRWSGPDKPPLFQALGSQEPGKALVCWRVEIPGQPNADTWTDATLQKAWADYYASGLKQRDLCLISGLEAAVARQHPKYIRWSGDSAKLISGDDDSGFTFRGRFREAAEAASVGYEASQKAHSALRWLIARQAFRNNGQVVLAWAVQGREIPPLLDLDFQDDPLALIIDDEDESPAEMPGDEGRPAPSHLGDVGQMFSLRLAVALEGYRRKLTATDEIVILGLDSVTKGRLSVTFYREKTVDQYLEAVKKWQSDLAWFFRGKDAAGHWRLLVVRAPTLSEIATAAYGRRLDDQLKKATVDRLLPVVADLWPLPRDLMENSFQRAVRPHSFEHHREWELCLATACALCRGFYARQKPQSRRIYAMTLESERDSRDYLYGRLLAVAEYLEKVALKMVEENRPTNAERLMPHFAAHPSSTWLTIEKAINPYLLRLVSSKQYAGRAIRLKRTLGEILNKFATEDFICDQRLGPEFLLGYHCQLRALWAKKEKTAEEEGEAGNTNEFENE